MRIHSIACTLTLLLLCLPAQAQNSEFTTLDALATVQIPVYGIPNSHQRLAATSTTYEIPTIWRDYQIGERATFYIAGDAGEPDELVTTALRGKTDEVLVWVQADVSLDHERTQALAERIDKDVLRRIRELFGYREPLGIDRDSRMTVLMVYRRGYWALGYADIGSMYPRYDNATSNQRDMFVINLADLDGGFIPEKLIMSTVAHEFQHNLLRYRDVDEETWLDEAFAMYAAYYISGSSIFLDSARAFLEAPSTRLTAWKSDEPFAEYGASTLFMVYLADEYGDALVRHLHAEADNGWRSVEKVLREYAGVSADEVFADWALANYFMDAELGYGYKNLDGVTTSAPATRIYEEFPARHSGSLEQYSSEYFAAAVGGADKLALKLTQDPVARLADLAPYEGDHVYYALTAAGSNNRLSRAFKLDFDEPVWLDFQIWHDLAGDHDIAYVELSSDGGYSWQNLKGKHTEDEFPLEDYSHHGYMGSSGGWLQERINLSDYASGPNVLLRFGVYTGYQTTTRALAIDDLRIGAINYRDGFETPDPNWKEEGWIRTDNRLPQRTWVQVVQETPEGLHLDRYMMNASGDVIVDLLPGVSIAHIVISPVVPATSLETEFSLELSLLDANNAPVGAPRSCTVTTTHGLNFRDAPNGDKIGLVPYGTAVSALEASEGWFRVIHDNKLGWVHGDYVTQAGICP